MMTPLTSEISQLLIATRLLTVQLGAVPTHTSKHAEEKETEQQWSKSLVWLASHDICQNHRISGQSHAERNHSIWVQDETRTQDLLSELTYQMYCSMMQITLHSIKLSWFKIEILFAWEKPGSIHGKTA